MICDAADGVSCQHLQGATTLHRTCNPLHTSADFQFAVSFPFHPYKDGRKGGEVTVIKEYAQVGVRSCLLLALVTYNMLGHQQRGQLQLG